MHALLAYEQTSRIIGTSFDLEHNIGDIPFQLTIPMHVQSPVKLTPFNLTLGNKLIMCLMKS